MRYYALLALATLIFCKKSILFAAPLGRPSVGIPSKEQGVKGGLTQQEVQGVVRRNINQVRYCYEQVILKNPSINGKLKLSWQIIANGTVQNIKVVSNETIPIELQDCVTKKLIRWRFPNPRQGETVDVNYPFVFKPE